MIRTLKIIEMLVEDEVITYKDAIDACGLLKICKDTRIPVESIDNFINELLCNYLLVEEKIG